MFGRRQRRKRGGNRKLADRQGGDGPCAGMQSLLREIRTRETVAYRTLHRGACKIGHAEYFLLLICCFFLQTPSGILRSIVLAISHQIHTTSARQQPRPGYLCSLLRPVQSSFAPYSSHSLPTPAVANHIARIAPLICMGSHKPDLNA